MTAEELEKIISRHEMRVGGKIGDRFGQIGSG